MDISSKKLAIFDLDGTLSPSKSMMDKEMSDLLVRLMDKMKVAVISGGGYPQFLIQFLHSLPISSDKYSNLILLPTSGTRMYMWKGDWVEQYAENLSKEDRERIISALKISATQSGIPEPTKIYGDIIEDRGSQITFSAIGQNAPLEAKEVWDKDRQKRQKIASILVPKIPEFDVRIGGATSIDITKKGVNKSYGIRKLEQILGFHTDDMIFVGDAIFPGGNDYPAKATGVDCIQVSGPEETKKVIAGWLG